MAIDFKKLSISQLMVLAADNMMKSGKTEFTEFDLTVATWKLSPERTGLHGYRQLYPDHKRIACKLTLRHCPRLGSEPVLRRIRPTVYTLTPTGIAEAARIRVGDNGSNDARYERMSRHLTHPQFVLWHDDPDQPRQRLDAELFLEDKTITTGIAQMRQEIDTVLAWMLEARCEALTCSRRSASLITRGQISELQSFLTALEYRFVTTKKRK